MSGKRQPQENRQQSEILLSQRNATLVMEMLRICDAEGVGPTIAETREIVLYIYEEHPDVFSRYLNTPCARDAIQMGRENEEAAA